MDMKASTRPCNHLEAEEFSSLLMLAGDVQYAAYVQGLRVCIERDNGGDFYESMNQLLIFTSNPHLRILT